MFLGQPESDEITMSNSENKKIKKEIYRGSRNIKLIGEATAKTASISFIIQITQ